MLLRLCQLDCFPLLCLSLLWIRCVRRRTTHLSRRPCTRRGFPGNPRRHRSVQPRRWSLLLTVVAPPPWCRDRRSRPRRPLLPLPSRVGSGRGTRERPPFRMPPAVPVASEGVPGSSPPDGVPPLIRYEWEGCLSAHWRHWQDIGAESWVLSVLQDRYCIPFVDSPPPLAHTPILFLTYRSGSPQLLVLGQEIEMLVKDALETVLDMGPGFYSCLFFMWRRRQGAGVP